MKKEKNKTQRNLMTLDAKDQSFGRLASNVSLILQGKNKASFLRYLDRGDFVEVKNIEKVKITGNKLKNKLYYHYSGYPGGMKKKSLGEVFAKDPAEILRRAVYNMLPKNRLRKERMKRLKFV